VRPAARSADAVTLGALLAAAPLGALALSPQRLLLAAVLGGALFVAAVWTLSRRDPALALAALWLYQLVRTPLAAALREVGPAGALVDQLTDVAAAVLVLSLVWRLVAEGERRDLRLLLPALVFGGVGLVSSVLASAPATTTLEGLWLATKLWVLAGLALALPWTCEDTERVFRLVMGAGAVVAVLGIADYLSAGAVAGGLHSNLNVSVINTYRSGAAQAVFSTPNDYSLGMSLLVAIGAARLLAAPSPRRAALLILFVLAAVLSLRLKAVLCTASVLGIVTAIGLLRGRRIALAMALLGLLGVATIIAAEGQILHKQVSQYTSSQGSARSALYRGGITLANEHAPFGVGFGRYASQPSREHYSSVYDDLGLSRMWGLSREFPRFISDTSWPSVMGETGYAGLAVYLAGLLGLIGLALSRLRNADGADLFAPAALLAVLAVVAVDATGAPTLFTWTTATMIALTVAATAAQPVMARRR
jgi:hypothetical protein